MKKNLSFKKCLKESLNENRVSINPRWEPFETEKDWSLNTDYDIDLYDVRNPQETDIKVRMIKNNKTNDIKFIVYNNYYKDIAKFNYDKAKAEDRIFTSEREALDKIKSLLTYPENSIDSDYNVYDQDFDKINGNIIERWKSEDGKIFYKIFFKNGSIKTSDTRRAALELVGHEFEEEDESPSNSEYEDIGWSFKVYELDEDGDELDGLESFDTKEEAIEFARKQPFPTHIVFVTNIDPDDDPDYADWLEYNAPYGAYEIVWESEELKECLHLNYDDEFEERNNYYDVETAHEFVGLDDTAPKARKYNGEEIEIEYDDEF